MAADLDAGCGELTEATAVEHGQATWTRTLA
jgi:hypothetical protein